MAVCLKRLKHQITVMLFILTDQCTQAGENAIHNHYTLSASLGDPAVLFCNISLSSANQIDWRKDRHVIFSHLPRKNQTFKNISSDRIRVDPEKLQVLSTQVSDDGIYTCTETYDRGMTSTEWILHIKGNSNETELQNEMKYTEYRIMKILLYSVPAVVSVGLLYVARLCRRNWNQQDDAIDNLSEANVPKSWKSSKVRRTSRKQYIERVNSVYGSSEPT